MELLLVRHGESVGNAEGRMQGLQDWPLSERGRAQARVLGRWLAERRIGWDAAYCSPLGRARETALLLHEVVGGTPPLEEGDLVEVDSGRLSGLTREDMERQEPEFLRRDVQQLGDFGDFGGEGYDAVQERVQRLLDRLLLRHRPEGHRVLLVAHGGILFQMVKALVCVPVPRVCILRFGNCTATLVRFRERRGAYLGEVAWHVPLELLGAPVVDGTAALFR